MYTNVQEKLCVINDDVGYYLRYNDKILVRILNV